jgi:hypothetical protein
MSKVATPKRCDQCHFWRRLDIHGVPDLVPGHCHRLPPQQIGGWHDAPSVKREVNAWSFPVVYASAWCGEHREADIA